MISMLLSLLCTILSLTVANAQSIVTSSAASVAASTTVSQSMPPAATQGFDISLVDSSTLFNWCLAQQHVCPQICGDAASVNTCDSATLVYSCICPNGTVPDSSAFQQTVPFFMCEENYGQCINRNANNAEAQAACRTNQQCGTRNATAEAIAATLAAQSTTSSSTLSTSSSSLAPSRSSSMTTSSTASSISSAAHSSTSSSSNTSSIPSSSTSSSVSPSASPSTSPGLSSAAYAGIGVGITLAVVGFAAIAFFLFKRHRRNLKNKAVTSQPQNYPEISSFGDPTGKSELQGDAGQKYGFKTTVLQKSEMQTASNYHEAEGVSATLNRPWSTDGRHELHEDSVQYQRNGGSDTATTAYDEKNGYGDGWGGGPGAAASDTRSAR